MMRLSTSTCIQEHVLWNVNDLYYSAKDSIDACAAAGFQTLDFNFASYSKRSGSMTKEYWEDWLKELKEHSNQRSITYSQAHANYYSWNQFPPYVNEKEETLIHRSIIGAGIMNVAWLVIHPCNIIEQGVSSYKKSLAAKHGVNIAIENMIAPKHQDCFGASPEDLLELLQYLNPKQFGICWDTGHAHINGTNQNLALHTIGSHLKALHINDNHGILDEHTAPYLGTIDWDPILLALKNISYQGDFTLELLNYSNGMPPELHSRALRFAYELGSVMLERLSLIDAVK